MEFKKLNINEASKRMLLWTDNSEEYIRHELDPDFKELRNQLLTDFKKIVTAHQYTTDYRFGLFLFARLKERGFTVRDAADDDKWRYLSLCVIPDIVASRWGKYKDIRFYKQSSRIWLKTIWWYIYLSWQNNLEKTIDVIKDNTTDQILQLVDRIGKNGYYVEAYRKIMFYYWKARQNNSGIGEDEFRQIMTLHTATCKTIEPELCEGGADGYARMLFEKSGVDLK